jgi:hypothetical protein
MLGLRLQVTPVLLLPVTVEVNCCDCPGTSVAVVGLTLIITGVSVIVAVTVLDESTILAPSN